MTFLLRKHTNFVPSASFFLDNSDVESDSEVVQKKKKRVTERIKVMTKGLELKLMSKLKMMKSALL